MYRKIWVAPDINKEYMVFQAHKKVFLKILKGCIYGVFEMLCVLYCWLVVTRRRKNTAIEVRAQASQSSFKSTPYKPINHNQQKYANTTMKKIALIFTLFFLTFLIFMLWPVCVPIDDKDGLFESPTPSQLQSNNTLKMKDGRLCQCKSRISRVMFF